MKRNRAHRTSSKKAWVKGRPSWRAETQRAQKPAGASKTRKAARKRSRAARKKNR